jgi:hypothetical protein
MATGVIPLSVLAGVPGDGTSGNAGPQLVRRVGTETNPKKQFMTADFDAATAEHMWWTFTMPQNYASAPVVRLMWQSNATTNSAIWGARLGAITPADTDTPIEHAQATASTTTTATNATEARRLNTTTITLANLDSVAAGDLVFLLVYRDAANGSDNLTVDAELIDVSFEYTTT